MCKHSITTYNEHDLRCLELQDFYIQERQPARSFLVRRLRLCIKCSTGSSYIQE